MCTLNGWRSSQNELILHAMNITLILEVRIHMMCYRFLHSCKVTIWKFVFYYITFCPKFGKRETFLWYYNMLGFWDMWEEIYEEIS